MKPEQGTVEFEGVVAIKDTGKALCCVIDGEQVWIPQSQIHDNSEVYDAKDNSEGTLVVTEWIALQKGLV